MVVCFSNSSERLDVLGPGSVILSTWPFDPFVEFASGTSAASPHAVGVAALLKDKIPSITVDDIARILKETGIPITDSANGRTTPRVDAYAAILEDSDGDGCADGNELQLATGSSVFGGLRDPEDPWDYYDVSMPKDGVIDLPNDILGVILHVSPGGNPPYTASYDRGSVIGPYSWNRSGPDGMIDLPKDILGVILQFQHSCS